MKLFYIIIILISLNAHAQEEYNIVPNWKKGETRYAQSTTTSNVFVNGESYQNTVVKSDYIIHVKSVSDQSYTVEYSQKSDQFQVDFSGPGEDSLQLMLMRIMERIEEISNEFKFQIVIDKENGQATKLLNADEFTDLVFEASESIIEELLAGKDIDLKEASSMMYDYFEASSAEMVQTVLNGVNYLFQCYNYICVIDDSITEEVMMNNMNALDQFGDVEIPAIATVSSQKVGDILNLSFSYDYDKPLFLDVIRSASPAFSDMAQNDFEIIEGQNVVFNMKSTWPEKFESIAVFDFTLPEEKTTIRSEELTTVIYSIKPR